MSLLASVAAAAAAAVGVEVRRWLLYWLESEMTLWLQMVWNEYALWYLK